MGKHSTFNVQHSTSKGDGGTSAPATLANQQSPAPLNVGSSILNVECSPWFFLNSGPCDAAFNMALDEALMEFAPQLGRPVLRFYGWTQPAASFGYFQHHAEIERTTKLRPLVRRP